MAFLPLSAIGGMFGGMFGNPSRDPRRLPGYNPQPVDPTMLQQPSAWDAAIQGGLGAGIPRTPDWNVYQPAPQPMDAAGGDVEQQMQGIQTPAPMGQFAGSPWPGQAVYPRGGWMAAGQMPLAQFARGGLGLIPQLLQRLQSQGYSGPTVGPGGLRQPGNVPGMSYLL
jgi:hypothetical protein